MRSRVLMGILTFSLVFTTLSFASWLVLEERIVSHLAHVEVDPDQFEVNLEQARVTAEFDFSVIDELGLSGVIPYLDAEVSPIGEVIVPSGGIHLPIFHGVSEPHISLGAATLTPDQRMGEGNYSLASHYMPFDGLLFGSLHEVEIGDLIVLRDATYLYLYNAISNEVVSAYLVEILDEIEGRTLVTLITCTSDGRERVAVQGEFISQVLIADLTPDDLIQGVKMMPLLEFEAVQFPKIEVISAVVGSAIMASLVTWKVDKKR